MPSEIGLICVEEDYVIGGPVGAHAIILKRLARVEVEDEKSRSFLIDYKLVFFVTHRQELMFGSHGVQDFRPLVHLFVEVAELAEAQVFVTKQVPLAPAVVIAEVVAFAGEVDPLRMPEFIPHESEERFSSQGLSK